MKTYNVLVHPDGSDKPKQYSVLAKNKDDALLWGLILDEGIKFPEKITPKVIKDHIELAKMYCEIL